MPASSSASATPCEAVRARRSTSSTSRSRTGAAFRKTATSRASSPSSWSRTAATLNGFILIRGDAEKLSALRVSEEFTQLTLRAALHVENIGVVAADMGERLQSQMAYYIEQISAIA